MHIHWTKALATGHPELDAQHQELFARADRLVAAASATDGDLRSLVARLHQFATEHFALEEGLMRGHGFAGYERHRAQHARFAADLLAFADDLANHPRRGGLDPHAGEWIGRWLEEHVTVTDAELAAFLAKAGAAGARKRSA